MALDLPTVVLHGHLPLLKVPSWPGPNRDQRSHEGPHPVAHLPSGQVRWDSAKWRPHCRWLHKSPPIRSWCIGRCPTPIRKLFLLFLNSLTLNFLPVWYFNESFAHLACLQVVPQAPPNKYYLPPKWDEVLQCWEAVDSSTQTLLSLGRSHVRTPFWGPYSLHFSSWYCVWTCWEDRHRWKKGKNKLNKHEQTTTRDSPFFPLPI
jgi:hypothetical protein